MSTGAAYTSLKAKKQYTYQISPYKGEIKVEIICTHKSFHNPELNLWLACMTKSFGRFLGSPREKDWKNARKWADEQLKLISQYGTVIITKPEYLKD